MSTVHFLCHISDILFGRFSEKLKIIANVLVHDWKMLPPDWFGTFYDSFRDVSEEKVNSVFHELDEESKRHARIFVSRQRAFYLPSERRNCFFYNHEKLLGQEQIKLSLQTGKKLKKLYRSYHLSEIPGAGGETESLITHHGLSLAPEYVLQYIKNGLFFDVGAFSGDSSLIFSKFYQPSMIYAFEPSEGNRKIYTAVMQANNVNSASFSLVPFGVGVQNEVIFVKQTTGGSNSLENRDPDGEKLKLVSLDSYSEENHLKNIKLIKADIEGMGLKMLQGAEKIIRENRPVLSLSIYHNQEEFFGIYETLKSWNLRYHIILRCMAYPKHYGELALFAWPMEIEKE